MRFGFRQIPGLSRKSGHWARTPLSADVVAYRYTSRLSAHPESLRGGRWLPGRGWTWLLANRVNMGYHFATLNFGSSWKSGCVGIILVMRGCDVLVVVRDQSWPKIRFVMERLGLAGCGVGRLAEWLWGVICLPNLCSNAHDDLDSFFLLPQDFFLSEVCK